MNFFMFVLLFAAGFLILRFLLGREPFSTPSGAIVMASGIFIYASMAHFPWLVPFGRFLAAVLFVFWVILMVSFICSIFQGEFYDRHLKHPINVFAIGTWVAGTSVLGDVFSAYFTDWELFLTILAILNFWLWIGYIIYCAYVFRWLLKKPYMNRVHGMILLPTVSLQSLVILFHNVFGQSVPEQLNRMTIIVGILFYICGLIVMIRRFSHPDRWGLLNDWLPANCILHGAMSITGLAAVATGAIPARWIFWIWIWVFGWFVIVECVECVRLILRVKDYGIVKGFGEYHPTQWSRIFTFGMLFAFTNTYALPAGSGLSMIRELILNAGPWAVLILLVNEILLFLKAKMKQPILAAIFDEKKA